MGQLGLKAGGIQLRRRQQRPLAQGAAFAQQRGEPIGSDGGGINRARCRVGCNLPPPAPRGFARISFRLAGRPDPFQQHARRFVVGVLGHQLAAEGLGQQGWGEAIDDLAGGGEAGFELVGEGEEVFYTTNNLFLFSNAWEGNGYSGDF